MAAEPVRPEEPKTYVYLAIHRTGLVASDNQRILDKQGRAKEWFCSQATERAPICLGTFTRPWEDIGLPNMLKVHKKKIKLLYEALKANEYLRTEVKASFIVFLLLYLITWGCLADVKRARVMLSKGTISVALREDLDSHKP